MTAAVAELARYRALKDFIGAHVRGVVRDPFDGQRYAAFSEAVGAVLKNHGWQELRFPTFRVVQANPGMAAIRGRAPSVKLGQCPYCGSRARSWVAGEGVLHWGCLNCGGVYLEGEEDKQGDIA